jgi:two-component system C4-dicarboxylate transport sensor histidine kinase DctB
METRFRTLTIIQWLFVAAVTAVVIIISSYFLSLRVFQTFELENSQAKLTLYQTTVENELSRLSHLPSLLARNEMVSAAIVRGETAPLDQKFKDIAISARAEAIYLLDKTGETISASNFDLPQTFLGQNYSFRPYFKTSIAGAPSSFFAIGATTSRPGYFLAAPVETNGSISGVLVVKLDLTALNQVLAASKDLVTVTDKDGIIVLSSNDELKYKTSHQISDIRLEEIKQARQFGSVDLTILPWDANESEVKIDRQSYLHFQQPLSSNNWTVHYFADFAVSQTRAFAFSAILIAFLVALGTTFILWRGQRLQRALVASQKDRRRIQKEIEVRRKAERHLEDAQKKLKRTSKMAALGQLSASVTHELGQPISAMKNHLTAETISNAKPSPVIADLTGIVQRMEKITQQLRFFTSETMASKTVIDLSNAADNAISMVRHDLNDADIDFNLATESAYIMGNSQRLEQLIINLVKNAIKAMAETDIKKLDLTISRDPEFCEITVTDTGHGLRGQTVEDIIEPFHTTGASGEGMGLGLAISSAIIEEHHGFLSAHDNQEGGLIVQVRIPTHSGDHVDV